MASFRLRQLESVEQLRATAAAWDDLWRQSETTIPTARARLVAIWLDHFARGATFRALVVDDGDRTLAALPLVERRVCRFVRCGGLTSNCWSPNADLLVNPSTDVEGMVDMLAGAMESMAWPLFWFDLVPIAQPGWQALVAALRRRGLRVDVHPRWEVGQIVLRGDVEAYLGSRSKNLRRSLRRDAEHLEKEAPLELHLEERFTAELAETRLREIFTIEDRGWKGAGGGSVLRHPSMFEFYRQQACQLAKWDALRVARLLHGERTIAFDLGWMGRGVYHSYKVGYDPDYRRFGPGHLLRERLVRALAPRGDVRAIDFQGPQTEALAAWSTRSYPIGRLVIAQRRLVGRALWSAYHVLARAARLWRKVRPW